MKHDVFMFIERPFILSTNARVPNLGSVNPLRVNQGVLMGFVNQKIIKKLF